METKNQTLKGNINFEVVKKSNLLKAGEFSIYNNKMMMKISRECGAKGLSVYMCLYSHLNKSNGVCNPSILTISAETGIKSDKTVRLTLNKLKEKGFIEWVQVKTKTNAFNNNHYAFLYRTVLANNVIIETPKAEVIDSKKKFKPGPRPDKSKLSKQGVEIEDEAESKTTLGKLKSLKSKMNREYSNTKSTGALKNLNNLIDQVISGRLDADEVKGWLVNEIGVITGFKFTLDTKTVKLIKKIK